MNNASRKKYNSKIKNTIIFIVIELIIMSLITFFAESSFSGDGTKNNEWMVLTISCFIAFIPLIFAFLYVKNRATSVGSAIISFTLSYIFLVSLVLVVSNLLKPSQENARMIGSILICVWISVPVLALSVTVTAIICKIVDVIKHGSKKVQNSSSDGGAL